MSEPLVIIQLDVSEYYRASRLPNASTKYCTEYWFYTQALYCLSDRGTRYCVEYRICTLSNQVRVPSTVRSTGFTLKHSIVCRLGLLDAVWDKGLILGLPVACPVRVPSTV